MLKLLIVDDETPARKELRYLIEEASSPRELCKSGKQKRAGGAGDCCCP